MPPPPTVGHPDFRDFKRARSDANQAVLSLLMALRLGRYELERLPRSQSETLLGDYYEHEISDIRDFNYRASRALDLLTATEGDLAHMTLPFATSIYEDYLADLAAIARRDGHGAIPRRPGAFKLHEYLSAAGIALPTKERLLFEAIRTIRNCIVHSAGYADEEAEVAVAALIADGPASTAWQRIAKTAPPPVEEGKRIELTGRDALISLYSVSHAAYALNNVASAVISRRMWADIAILDFRNGSRRWAHGLTDVADLRRYVDRSYALLRLTNEELRDAVRRAPNQSRLP